MIYRFYTDCNLLQSRNFIGLPWASGSYWKNRKPLVSVGEKFPRKMAAGDSIVLAGNLAAANWAPSGVMCRCLG
jgi:hypothetical protein